MKRFIAKYKRMVFAISALLVLFAGIAVYTFSKYLSDEAINGTIALEEFYAIARIYYEDNGEKKEVTVDPLAPKEYIELTPAQFETATVNIEYTGEAKTYCRFKLDCSWMREASDEYIDDNGDLIQNTYYELVPHEYPEFTYDGEIIYDNVSKDGWFYIKEIMQSEGETVKTVNAISEVNTGNDLTDPIDPDDKAEILHLAVTVDCVQYNRVSALWKMNTLPWWGT